MTVPSNAHNLSPGATAKKCKNVTLSELKIACLLNANIIRQLTIAFY
jgi:hypothetical protein